MLREITAAIAKREGKAFYVGGYVRNHVMGLPHGPDDDIDIEVYHLSFQELHNVLSAFGRVRAVGKVFPILKINGHPEWDFAIPEEQSTTYRQASARRDFTVNSLLMDIITGEIIDLYGGTQDLNDRLIRHTNPEVFNDDPVRVYRALAFAGRLNFAIHPQTLELLKFTDLTRIKPERVYNELRKLLLLSAQPSIGWRLMQITGVLEKRHPLLFSLIGCPQSEQHHPEGDVWEHTLRAIDRAAQLRSQSIHPEALMWAALLHDIGKPTTTEILDGKITSHGHHQAGEQLARMFLQELTAGNRIIDIVAGLVGKHMQPILLYKSKAQVTDRMIRQLVVQVNLRELLLLAEADSRGRDLNRDFATVKDWLTQRLACLGLNLDSKIDPLVKGRDIQQLGISPGPIYKDLLKRAWDMQLDGWAKPAIINNLSDICK